jgi:glycine C-acetyltransferase
VLDIQERLRELESSGLRRRLRMVDGPQGPEVMLDGRPVLLLCSNNYLGLADHPRLRRAAADAALALGTSSGASRLISGSMSIHADLETKLADFEGTEAALLFGSGYLANTGAIAALARRGEVVFSDALNHASIIDGCRLAGAETFVYRHRDTEHLEWGLRRAADRCALIVTDGVFSMDGFLAPLEAICDLAEKYDALVMVDDSHAVGFMGATGAGTPEHAGVSDRVDIYTGTFGKALGGASGGYVSGRGEIVAMLRQKARPYLFSNSLAPAIVAATLQALDLVENSGELRSKLFANAGLFRNRMAEEGFELLPGEHAIVPVMFGDAVMAAKVADEMLHNGVFVTAFSYPVVPKGAARIRVQLSAAHSAEDIEACVQAFVRSRAAVAA